MNSSGPSEHEPGPSIASASPESLKPADLSDIVMTASDSGSSIHESDRHPVDVLADEFSARLRAGETPSIEEYAQRASEHRDEIYSLFPTIAAIEQMSDQEHKQRRSKRRLLVDQDIIGDFRILREVGRGGMGIVYEAEQQSLQRRVALKVLGAGISESPQQLQRFRLEAESVARLHHTNIVQVYGIGEEDGIHFYAMQFIDGVSLSDAIQEQRKRSTNETTAVYDVAPSTSERSSTIITGQKAGDDLNESVVANPPPSPPQKRVAALSHSSVAKLQSATEGLFSQMNTTAFFRGAARLTAQVADALDYAHGHGVLHRDIKPSNLMIDRSGDVWIMDFGLVKIAERHDLTRTGEIVGTLRYMAPEQLTGQAGTATDIYSLGLTLFELVTLKPAFDGDSSATFSQRMRGCEIPRPRSVNPAVPRDLETIILKATAREPSARYATSAALAEDLRRFCDDRPILARRSTLIERLWRWSRRNPALAFATTSVILLLGLVAGISTTARFRVEAALEKTRKAQKQAEDNIDLAINAFGSILDNVTSRGLPRSLALDVSESESDLTQTPLSDADALLLDRLLEFYRDFARQSEDNSQRRLLIADAHHRAGTILVRLGRLKEAEDDFQKAIELLANTAKNDSNYLTSVVKSAAIFNEIGELRLRRGEFRQTSNAHLEARALLMEQPPYIRAEPAVRFEFARATDLLASIDVRSGSNEGPGIPPQSPDGKRPPRSDGGGFLRFFNPNGQRPPRPFEGEPPPPESGPDGRRGPRPNRDGPPGENGPPDGRRPDRRPPQDDFPKKPGEGNQDGQTPERLRRAEPEHLKKPGGRPGPIDGLAATLLEACEEFRSLTREFPDNAEYQFHLAKCLRHRLVHAATGGDTNVAKETYVEAVAILDRLATDHPNDPKYLVELADTLTQASRAQSEVESKVSLDRAVATAQELAKRFTSVSEYQLLLGTALARSAYVQAASGSTSDAEVTLTQSLAILKELTSKFADQGIFQIPLARTSQQYGELLRSTAGDGTSPNERLNESKRVLQDAINRFDEYLSKTGKQGNFNASTQSNLYFSLAETLTRLKQPDQAEQARRKAMEGRRPGPRPR